MRLSNRQIRANLKFIEFSCKKSEPEFDEEKEALIERARKDGVIKTDPSFMHVDAEEDI